METATDPVPPESESAETASTDAEDMPQEAEPAAEIDPTDAEIETSDLSVPLRHTPDAVKGTQPVPAIEVQPGSARAAADPEADSSPSTPGATEARAAGDAPLASAARTDIASRSGDKSPPPWKGPGATEAHGSPRPAPIGPGVERQANRDTPIDEARVPAPPPAIRAGTATTAARPPIVDGPMPTAAEVREQHDLAAVAAGRKFGAVARPLVAATETGVETADRQAVEAPGRVRAAFVPDMPRRVQASSSSAIVNPSSSATAAPQAGREATPQGLVVAAGQLAALTAPPTVGDAAPVSPRVETSDRGAARAKPHRQAATPQPLAGSQKPDAIWGGGEGPGRDIARNAPAEPFSPLGEAPAFQNPRVDIPAPPSVALPVDGATGRPEMGRYTAAQMVDHIVSKPDRPVEISLSPEELGRVRMALKASESGVTVHIAAERQDTMDLLRRHIDQLASEFRRLGYEQIGFEFSGGSAGGFPQNAHCAAGILEDTGEPVPAEPRQPARVAVATGLDLRL